MTLPSDSLQHGTWFKLICGASFQHLSSVRDLALLYTLAGADCIDIAADAAVVRAAQAGIALAQQHQPHLPSPWLMASFNDGEDPHFRKADLQPGAQCPAECPQPCLAVCPPHAISWATQQIQIHQDLCYGCGRCEPVCPHDLIETLGHHRSVGDLLPELIELGICAIEIHTHIGRRDPFAQIWQQLLPWLHHLEVVSISFNDGPGLETYLRDLVHIMDPLPRRLIWQTDGRPMSGDIGAGTTGLTLRLAHKVLSFGLPGYVQLAGGTNGSTVAKLDPNLPIAGVAYGSYARQQVADLLDPLCETPGDPSIVSSGAEIARSLVQQIKQIQRDPLSVGIRDPVGPRA